jgi:O-antigen ligase
MNRDTRSIVSPHLLRWTGIALAAMWLGYYICSGMPQSGLQVFPRVIALHAMTFALTVIYAGYLLVCRRLPGGSRLDWPLFLLLLAYLAATAASIDWRVSIESTLLVIMAIVVFYALSDAHFLGPLSLQHALMLAGAAASAWALWIVAGDYADWLNFARSAKGSFHLGDLIPPTVPKVHGVGDHPNILGMTLTLIIPFYIVAIYRGPSYWERLAWGAALLAAAWAIFLTLSRGAWIGGLTGAAITISAIVVTTQTWPRELLQRTTITRRLRERRTLLTLAGALAVALVIAAAAVTLMTQWQTRPQWLFRQSLSPRQDVYEAGIDIFRDYPLLGSGPGTFGLLYPEYSGKNPIYAIHAHNGYIQAGVDTGLVGLAALAILGGALVWLLWESYGSGSRPEKLIVIGCAGALVGFAVHNLADAANVWKTPLVALAAVLAIAVQNHRRVAAAKDTATPVIDSSKDTQSPLSNVMTRAAPLLPRALMAIAMLGLFISWGWIDAAHYHYSDSLTKLRNGATFDAVLEARQAVDMDPNLAIYQLQLGLTEGLAFEKDGAEEFLKQSIEHLQRGVDLDPRSAIGYVNLARALELQGASEEAHTAALTAERFAGADATVHLAAGNILERVGSPEEAVTAYAMAVTQMSSLADSTFWMGSEFRREHYDDILQNSSLALNRCSLGSLLARASTGSTTAVDEAGLLEGCTLFVLGNPDNLDARIELAQMLMTAGDYGLAFEHLNFVVKREPDLGPARTTLGKWYAAQGDIDRARKEWTLAAQLAEPEALVLLGDSFPPGQIPSDVVKRLAQLAPTKAGGTRYYPIGYVYYRMKFGRESSPIILMPGEWENALPGEYEMIQEALQRWRTPQ